MAITAAPSNTNNNKKVPLSIEALLAEQRREKDEQSKPKFLTKAQREALAQDKQKAEAAVKNQRSDETQARRSQFEAQVNAERASSSRDYRHNAGSYSNGRQQQQQNFTNGGYNAPSGPRSMRDAPFQNGRSNENGRGYNNDRRGNGYNSSAQRQQDQPVASTSTAQSAPSQSNGNGDLPIYDEAAVKARYLGDKSLLKKKIRKQSDKKFVFDWDKTEDTATADEVDPLYKALRAGGSAAELARYHASNASTPVNGGQTTANGHSASMNTPDDDVALAGPRALPSKKGKGAAIMDERHWSEKTLTEMRERDWRIFREDFSIAARGGSIPLPMRYWHESTIPEDIQRIIADVGYEQPSAIQRQAIPIGLNVRDMIGIAETGSGKTAAFVIPMLTYISRLPPLSDANRHMGPYALIMAPTRELAQQIEVETKKFTDRLGYTCVSIVGGRSVEEQSLSLRNGAEIIIATPGRLKDCIERSIVVFSQCTYVVMDEADRMISLGFEDVINFILDTLPVSNLKPDTEEAEDAGKMLQRLIGGPDGEALADVYMYRQTVRCSRT